MRTRTGWVYVAFIVDIFAQRRVGWHAATCKDVYLMMTPLRMAIWARERTLARLGQRRPRRPPPHL